VSVAPSTEEATLEGSAGIEHLRSTAGSGRIDLAGRAVELLTIDLAEEDAGLPASESSTRYKGCVF
jgi:hypothetical protein